MKLKRLIKFYFNAEKFNEWLDGLIAFRACRPRSPCGLDDFEGVAKLIGDKIDLERLYCYLKDIMDGLTEADRQCLWRYARLRTDIKKLGSAEYREFKRALMKFSRRLNYAGVYAKEIGTLNNYAALI